MVGGGGLLACCHGCSLLFRWFLTSIHALRMADRGETAPYWLGAAQLEAGDSCPVRSENLSHRREQLIVPCSAVGNNL